MNEKDLRDIEPYVTNDLNISFVENIEEVLKIAFPESSSDDMTSLPRRPEETSEPPAPGLRV
jgi:ATP-dependent Lon protease